MRDGGEQAGGGGQDLRHLRWERGGRHAQIQRRLSRSAPIEPRAASPYPGHQQPGADHGPKPAVDAAVDQLPLIGDLGQLTRCRRRTLKKHLVQALLEHVLCHLQGGETVKEGWRQTGWIRYTRTFTPNGWTASLSSDMILEFPNLHSQRNCLETKPEETFSAASLSLSSG